MTSGEQKCDEVARLLVDYHFATLASPERLAVEEHLPACRGCVTRLVALKRDIETDDEDIMPSRNTRERIRSAIADEILGKSPVARVRRWERPLAFGFAAAAVLVAMAVSRGL